jgi:hypothetical protein
MPYRPESSEPIVHHARLLVPALVLWLAPLCVAQDAAAAAQWPKPAPGWWEKLKAGDRAVYEVRQGPQAMRLVITVDKVEAEKVTFSAQTFLGEQPAPRQTQTIDARTDEDANGQLPPEAKVKKVAEEKLEVGGRTFACTVYEIALHDATIKAWHCPDLPPIFSASNVKVEAEAQGEPSSMKLVELTLGSAAPGEGR